MPNKDTERHLYQALNEGHESRMYRNQHTSWARWACRTATRDSQKNSALLDPARYRAGKLAPQCDGTTSGPSRMSHGLLRQQPRRTNQPASLGSMPTIGEPIARLGSAVASRKNTTLCPSSDCCIRRSRRRKRRIDGHSSRCPDNEPSSESAEPRYEMSASLDDELEEESVVEVSVGIESEPSKPRASPGSARKLALCAPAPTSAQRSTGVLAAGAIRRHLCRRASPRSAAL